jgi:tetraacyldisaccharide-1-P 4'-kinase
VSQLRAVGIEPVAEKFYRDHHPYTQQDIQELLEIRRQNDAGGFVTTEKDAINLGPLLSMLQPLSVVPVRMELVNAANAVDTMLSMVAKRKRLA